LPTEPALLHASHDPLHAPSQHTPSAQTPLAHSDDVPQGLPLRLAQYPFTPALHEALAPQEPTPQQTPSVQNPLVHVEAVVHVVPSPSMGMHAPDLQ
jgi:hypothetical protein